MTKIFSKVALVTGGFDPIHSGHITYFNNAKLLAPYLIVGINSDEWLERKKQNKLQNWSERETIIKHLKMVDLVISYNDQDDSSCAAISKCLKLSEKVVFCNGGDRKKENIPEIEKFKNNNKVEFEFGIGGDDKLNSSSWILNEYFERQLKLYD